MASGTASRTDSSQIETAFRHVQKTALDVWMSIGFTMALYLAADTESETAAKHPITNQSNKFTVRIHYESKCDINLNSVPSTQIQTGTEQRFVRYIFCFLLIC